MSKGFNFDDSSFLSSPHPICSSSITTDLLKKINLKMNDIPERDSDIDSSLGIISIQSGEMPYSETSTALLLKKERQQASNLLKKYDTASSQSSNVVSLPSRFMVPSDITDNSYGGKLIQTESDISESDLLKPDKSSTPRESLANSDYIMRERFSQGAELIKLSGLLKNPGVPINVIGDQVHSITKIENSSSFDSGEDAFAKIIQGEMSWKNKNHIPTEMTDFSISLADSNLKHSIGDFFKQKSEDPSELFNKSPVKDAAPQPLLNTSRSLESADISLESIDMNDIQHILSQNNTKDAIKYLNLPLKKKSLSPVKVSPTKTTHQEINPPRVNPIKKSPIAEMYEKKKPKQKSLPLPRAHFTKQTKAQTPPAELLKKVEKSEDSFPEISKENISPDNNHEKSILSSRCSSSLSTLPNGKLPIATTKPELIWGCIKPGKSVTREFVLRNRSQNRLGIQASVSNPSFRLNKEGVESTSSSMIKVVLHPYESRSLSVTFAPTSLGAAVDCLNFNSIDPNHKQIVKQYIKLYGYGGYGTVSFNNITKDTTGKYLLSLGNLDEKQELKQSFFIKNNGTLAMFAFIDFVLNGVYPFSNIEVYPQAVVLKPDEEKEIVVTYNVQKKDFVHIKVKINQSVINVGRLQIMHGTEVNRARLRKTCQKAKEKGQDIKSFVLPLIEKFPGEVIPTDLKYFRESTSSMDEFFKLLNNEEIIVILEQDIDHTLTANQLQDETALFHSLLEKNNSEFFETTNYTETCLVEPSRIILTPPDKIKDRIFLTNHNKIKLYFEINSTPEGLDLSPTGGSINPGELQIIDLKYTKKSFEKTVFKVRILLDNESFEVDVKIMFVNKS